MFSVNNILVLKIMNNMYTVSRYLSTSTRWMYPCKTS